MLAAVLAFASSLAWGVSDFLGGLLSRRHSVLAVLALSQGFALALLLAAIAAGAPTEHDAAATAWAAGSGLADVLAFSAFYRALTIGTMSIVAPLSATGAMIPVLVGIASGERPRLVQLAGIALAVTGVVLVAREAVDPDQQVHRDAHAGTLLALLSALGFGAFFAGMDRAEQHGELAWLLLAARAPGVLVLLAACMIRRPRLPTAPATLGATAVIGGFDVLAGLLFVVATGRGLLSVVGVLAALYPAMTVLLARALLHERLTRRQIAGVLIVLAGVLAMAAGA